MAYKKGVADNLSQVVGSSFDDIDPITRQMQKLAEAQLTLNKSNADKLAKYERTLQKKSEAEKLADAKATVKAVWAEEHKFLNKVGETLSKATSKAISSLNSSVDQYIQMYSKFMGTISTRLQGSDLSFSSISGNVARNLSTSPYLRQSDMITNLNKFVESGVAYNLELRAYIATATDRIAATFDAFDSSLLRLVRIQQSDSTVARAGMQSALNKFLNSNFKDTSYLGTGSRSTTANLLEAESLMGRNEATELEYVVQKWLGSLSALGVSDSAVSAISQGIGYLGSGNVSALTGNTGLNSLMALAAGRAGLSYGNLLNRGINANQANALLSQIVGLGQEIGGSGSNVVMSEYARIFGLSVSDISSLMNVTANDLKEISSNLLTYEKMKEETASQLATMGQRMSISEKVGNVLSNLSATAGQGVADNSVLYSTWILANMMADSGIDADVKPFGIGTTASALMKLGVVGSGFITNLGGMVSNISGGNMAGTSLAAWSENETTRGINTKYFQSGVDTSASSYIGNMSSDVMGNTFQENQKQAAQYTGSDSEQSLEDAIKNHIQVDVATIASVVTDIKQILDSTPLAHMS